MGDFVGSCGQALADNGTIYVQFSETAMDVYVKNQVIWRGEGRFALLLLRPTAFCRVALAGAPPFVSNEGSEPAKK